MKPSDIIPKETKDIKRIQSAQPLTAQDRVRIAKSLFGILSPNMTLEETKEERLNNI